MRLLHKNRRTCTKGHVFYKSSECPTCPICKSKRKPKEGFLSTLVAPARRALENAGVMNVMQLSKFSEKDILELHGMGPSSMPKLKKVLAAKGLTFKK